jgi:hypothetical protein
MGEQFLYDYFLLPAAFWVILYISDYYLTIYGARLYKDASQYFSVEGSYELTPYYQQDIDALRLLSPRFLIALFASTLLLLMVRGLSFGIPAIYAFVCGVLMLMEAAIHFRHIRNIATYKQLKAGNAATGKLAYTRWFVYSVSATDIFAFSVFCLIIALLLGSWFFVGGAVGCLRLAIGHLLKSREARKQSLTPTSN